MNNPDICNAYTLLEELRQRALASVGEPGWGEPVLYRVKRIGRHEVAPKYNDMVALIVGGVFCHACTPGIQDYARPTQRKFTPAPLRVGCAPNNPP